MTDDAMVEAVAKAQHAAWLKRARLFPPDWFAEVDKSFEALSESDREMFLTEARAAIAACKPMIERELLKKMLDGAGNAQVLEEAICSFAREIATQRFGLLGRSRRLYSRG